MTLEELRHEMASCRKSSDDMASSLKDPHFTLVRLNNFYRNLDTAARQLANHILAEWALSEDENLRFDALGLIDDLNVRTAVPALETLAACLAMEHSPGAPYELKKMWRIIARFKA